MSLLTIPAEFGFHDENYGNSSTSNWGQNVASAATWAAATATALTFTDSGTTLDWNVHEMELVFSATRAAGVNRATLFRLLVDPAGGTSWSTLVDNLIVGNADDQQPLAPVRLPLYVPAGASLGVRAINASTPTVITGIRISGGPSQPIWSGGATETIGTVSGTQGVDLSTAGIGNGTLGSWVSIGTTVNNCSFFHLGVQMGDTNTSFIYGWLEMAYGNGSTQMTRIGHRYKFRTSDTEGFWMRCTPSAYASVPAGSTIYVRGQANADISSDGINCTVVGVY
jgi:hypothetical protein